MTSRIEDELAVSIVITVPVPADLLNEYRSKKAVAPLSKESAPGLPRHAGRASSRNTVQWEKNHGQVNLLLIGAFYPYRNEWDQHI